MKSLFAILFISIASLTIAQSSKIRAGIVVSDLYYFSKNNEEVEGFNAAFEPNYSPAVGFYLGVRMIPSKTLPLSFGLHYTRLGAKHRPIDDIEDDESPYFNWMYKDINYTLDYVVANSQYFWTLCEDQLHLSLGPQVGILINSKRDGSDGSENFTNSFNPPSSIDLGLLIGVDFSLSKSISIDLTAYNGFKPVDESNFDNPSKTYNRSFSLGLSCRVFSR